MLIAETFLHVDFKISDISGPIQITVDVYIQVNSPHSMALSPMS
jgi:hypothetical protein